MKKIETSTVFKTALVLWGCLFFSFGVVAQDTAAVRQPLKNTPEYLRAKAAIKRIKANKNYYYGMATEKIGNDYAKALKAVKNEALSNLAGKIRVRIESTVRRTITDKTENSGRDYSEKINRGFQEFINTNSTVNVEDYQDDQFENYPDSGYITAISYLDKNKYLNKIKTNLEAKKTIVHSMVNKANQLFNTGHYRQAVAKYKEAFNKLNELFPNVPLQDKLGNNPVPRPVAPYITGKVSFFFGGLVLSNNLSKTAKYDANGRMNQSIMIFAKYKDENGIVHPVPHLPLKAYFLEGSGNIFPGMATGQYGEAKLRISHVNPANRNSLIRISVDTSRISGLNIFPNILLPTTDIPLSKMRTLAFALSFHSNGHITSPADLRNTIQSELLTNGLSVKQVVVAHSVITPGDIAQINRNHPDYFLNVYLHTLNSGTVGGYKNVFAANLTGTIYLYELPLGNLIATRQLKTSEGYGGSAADAIQDAYNRLSKNILSKIQNIMEEIK